MSTISRVDSVPGPQPDTPYSRSRAGMNYRISVDGGGTFTDGILLDESGGVVVAKAHTTPQDFTRGTVECLSRLAAQVGLDLETLLARTATIVHGTTMATNTVATHTGAKL